MDWHAPDDPTVFHYLDESLSLPERRAFEAHLSQCPQCRRELSAAQRLASLTQAWVEVEPPARLADSIRSQLKPQSFARGWLLTAAAAAAILVLGLRGWPQPQPNSPEVGVSSPPLLATRPTPGPDEQATPLTLATANVWTTQSSPSVIALSGQILTLGAQSHLEVVSHRGNHYLLRLTRGEVRVQEHGETIAVISKHLRVDPLGTDYQVAVTPQNSRVHLYSGEVRVSSLGSHDVTDLHPGQTVQFPRKKPLLTAAPVAQPTPSLPALAYPQHAPTAAVTHLPQPQETPLPPPLWTEQPRSWRPQPEFHNPEAEMRNRNGREPGLFRPGQRQGQGQFRRWERDHRKGQL